MQLLADITAHQSVLAPRVNRGSRRLSGSRYATGPGGPLVGEMYFSRPSPIMLSFVHVDVDIYSNSH